MLNFADIQNILPHRYPFLLVDGVVEVSKEKIRAYKNVSFNEPHFSGHFPGNPVMPGVLIVEALAQAGGILAHASGVFDPQKQVLLFMTIDSAKFRRPVRPGDRLDLEVIPLRSGGRVWKMKGVAKVGEDVAAQAEFMATIVPKEQPVT
jgi:3-hydroxyacyl-[acyl-carrier-protein] dehydratase